MRIRKSKHQEKIYDAICGVGIHMSAEEIFNKVKETDESIGIATVYRQLNNLVSQNRILRIRDKDQGYIYDGNVTPHHHFYCHVCNNYTDVWMDVDENSIEQLKEGLEAEIHGYHLVFEGVCKHCKNKNEGGNYNGIKRVKN